MYSGAGSEAGTSGATSSVGATGVGVSSVVGAIVAPLCHWFVVLEQSVEDVPLCHWFVLVLEGVPRMREHSKSVGPSTCYGGCFENPHCRSVVVHLDLDLVDHLDLDLVVHLHLDLVVHRLSLT